MKKTSRIHLIQASAMQCGINAVINGAISYFMIRGKDVHRITADSITSGGSDTVVGHSVFTALILAVIFTLMGYRSHRQEWPNISWPEVIRLAAMNAIYAFGIIVLAGVLWQKIFPNITVSTIIAAAIAGLIAGIASGITNYTTIATLGDRAR